MKFKRENYLDTVAGVFIIIVITSHIFQYCNYNDNCYYDFFYEKFLYFYMPWFFFKSGLFHNSTTNVKTIIIKEYKRLIVPYIFFSLLGYIFYCIRLIIAADFNITHYFITPIKDIIYAGAVSSNLPLWFLLSFFGVKCITATTNNTNSSIYPLLLTILSLIIAITSANLKNIPYWIGNINSGIFFYMMGHFFRQLQLKPIIAVCSLILYITLVVYNPSYVDMRSNSIIIGNYIVWLIGSITGIISINNIFTRIKYSNILLYIGRNSMSYYTMHWIILYIIKTFTILIPINNNILLFIMFVSCIIFLPKLNTFFSNPKRVFLIGK
ncbi:acyltransferase family protein [uncultured Bacteroides sp.]|jgi:hypothetical protein|uniref:acyltransferase family protein n=1 Tax=uncultured Bacteroides sp. TaxID=162156 RepID=UPI0035A6AB14